MQVNERKSNCAQRRRRHPSALHLFREIRNRREILIKANKSRERIRTNAARRTATRLMCDHIRFSRSKIDSMREPERALSSRHASATTSAPPPLPIPHPLFLPFSQSTGLTTFSFNLLPVFPWSIRRRRRRRRQRRQRLRALADRTNLAPHRERRLLKISDRSMNFICIIELIRDKFEVFSSLSIDREPNSISSAFHQPASQSMSTSINKQGKITKFQTEKNDRENEKR